MKDTHFSEMSVAKAASLALMLQERAEPSRLFLSACMAMILQILLTAKGDEGFFFLEKRMHIQTENARSPVYASPCSDICLFSQILRTFRALRSVSRGTRSICSSR